MKSESLDSSIVKTLDKVQQGHAAQMIVDFLSDTLAEENASIDKEAFRMLQDRTLTPEAALFLWQRRYSMRALVRRLRDTIEVGRRAQTDHPNAKSS